MNLQVRIDHRTRSVHFGKDLAESQKAEVAEGPHVQVSSCLMPRTLSPHASYLCTFLSSSSLQAMPSEQVRTQLMSMMFVLNKSLDTIHPDRLAIETSELKTKITEAYHQSKVRDTI